MFSFAIFIPDQFSQLPNLKLNLAPVFFESSWPFIVPDYTALDRDLCDLKCGKSVLIHDSCSPEIRLCWCFPFSTVVFGCGVCLVWEKAAKTKR